MWLYIFCIGWLIGLMGSESSARRVAEHRMRNAIGRFTIPIERDTVYCTYTPWKEKTFADLQ